MGGAIKLLLLNVEPAAGRRETQYEVGKIHDASSLWEGWTPQGNPRGER